MAILDIFKTKKKKTPPSPPAPYPGEPSAAPEGLPAPIEQVRSMQEQNMDNSQIINALQAQGYDPLSIQDAIAEAKLGPAAGPVADVPGMPPARSFPKFSEPQAAAPSENMEELAESIVEEKWDAFMKELAKVNDWKSKTETRVSKLEQNIKDLKDDVENLHKAIVSKISDYDKNLLDVGTEIKAMEKVFQKVLPELTGSVSELSRITKGVKSKKKKLE
ncbi:hypothetical protein KY333_05395 [Candidatus Woesearchaeota archaeon]|nr:hypothetical protein [Candidatus Woesearchaeota archaeon]MBW2993955.1 hypothetical protein [Candidatus Woesearchaeota archaeon]